MTDDDDDDGKPDRLAEAQDALDRLLDNGRALAEKLAELNSLYPATKAFLALHGVSNVMELTPEQRAELMAVLEAERAALAKPSN